MKFPHTVGKLEARNNNKILTIITHALWAFLSMYQIYFAKNFSLENLQPILTS